MSRAAGVVGGVLGLALVGVVGMSFAVTQHWGPWAAEPPHEEVLGASTQPASGVVTVHLDECPGFTLPDLDAFDAAKRSPNPETSFAVIFPDHGIILASCMGSVEEIGMPADFTHDATVEGLSFTDQTSPVILHASFGDVVRWSGTLTSAEGLQVERLTDWYVERDGWVIGIGYLRKDTSLDRTAMVQDMVAGLAWS